MVSPFEDFINGMTESQYEYWLANEATEKQYDSAITIREELSEEQTEGIGEGEGGNTPEARQNRFIQFLRGIFNR